MRPLLCGAVILALCIVPLTGQAQDGALDATFGTLGKVRTDFASSSDHAYCVTIQPDQKIIAAGTSNSLMALARYLPNGSLDSTFGTGGKLTTADFGYSDAWAVRIQGDGKIVTAGTAYSPYSHSFAIARYDSTGVLDQTFGFQGTTTVTVPVGANDPRGYGMTLQRDGKIVVVGFMLGTSSEDIVIARLKSNGSLDSTFGVSGTVVTDVGGGYDEGRAVAMQGDGKIVVVGTANLASHQGFVVVRYLADGRIDSTFNGTGRTGIPIMATGTNETARAIAIDSSGRIVVAGDAYTGSRDYWALTRVLPSGAIDTTFGMNGVDTLSFQDKYDIAYALALQQDGKIVVSGISQNSGGEQDFALARFTGNGTLDPSFNGTGTIRMDMGGMFEAAYGVALQANGNIVAAGESANDFLLARFTGSSGPATGVVSERIAPAGFALGQNYPNPFNPTTSITYSLPLRSHVTLAVFNMLGQKVAELANGEQEAGPHTVRFDASALTSGVYFYRIEAAGFAQTRKLVLVK